MTHYMRKCSEDNIQISTTLFLESKIESFRIGAESEYSQDGSNIEGGKGFR